MGTELTATDWADILKPGDLDAAAYRLAMHLDARGIRYTMSDSQWSDSLYVTLKGDEHDTTVRFSSHASTGSGAHAHVDLRVDENGDLVGGDSTARITAFVPVLIARHEAAQTDDDDSDWKMSEHGRELW